MIHIAATHFIWKVAVMTYNITVEPVDKKWGCFVDGNLIGVSKARFDADFAAQVLQHKIQKLLEDEVCL